jgi:hypothetical protein
VNDDLQFKAFGFGLKIPIKAAAVFEAQKKVLSLEVSGGGEGSGGLIGPPVRMDKRAIKLFFGAKARVWNWEYFFEKPWEWKADATAAPIGDGVFGVRAVPRPHGAHLAVVPAGPGEQLLADPLDRLAQPAQAANGGNRIVAWVADDASRGILQGREIMARRWTGSAWLAASRLTDDTNLDFHPDIAYDQAGKAIAVWERNTQAGLPDDAALDEAVAGRFEIAYAVLDPATGIWSAPALVTSNDYLDHAPRLARSAGGELMLMWVGNQSNQLFADATTPDRLYAAVWNGSSWSAATLAVDGLAGMTGWSVAYRGDEARVVLARDTDGDPLTSDDIELYWATWNGSAWGSLSRLTDDTVADLSPAALYAPDGQARLVWLKGSQIFLLEGDWTAATPTPSVSDEASNLADFALTQDTAGRLVIVWQDTSEQGADIFYSVYDAAHSRWSSRLQLTADTPVESGMAPVFDGAGILHVAYAKSNVTLIERTVEITAGETITIAGVPELGATSLYVVSHTLRHDLAATSLTAATANPLPGALTPLTLTIANLGDFSETGFAVTLYDGVPGVGLPVITRTIANLDGGMTATQVLTWTASGGSHVLYARVDAGDAIAETDEANNVFSVTIGLPDLTVSGAQARAWAGQTITLTAAVVNIGTSAAPPSRVDIRADAITGTLLGSLNAPSLAAGASHAITFTWSVVGQPSAVREVYFVADGGNTASEADEENNAGLPAIVGVLPDLVVDSSSIAFDALASFYGPRFELRFTVRNSGLRNSAASVVGLYTAGDVSGHALWSAPVPALAAGQSTELRLTWQPIWGRGPFILRADAANAVTEASEENNAATIAAGRGSAVVLPVIVKAYSAAP